MQAFFSELCCLSTIWTDVAGGDHDMPDPTSDSHDQGSISFVHKPLWVLPGDMAGTHREQVHEPMQSQLADGGVV